MPRRKELKGVAIGLLGAFVSRKNAINGYWAIGKLYKLALQHRVSEFKIDLIKSSQKLKYPLNLTHDYWVDDYRRFEHYCTKTWLDYLRKREIEEWIQNSTLTIEFGASDSDPQLSYRYSDEQPFKCTLEIKDDRGRRYSAHCMGTCWPHNPTRERRCSKFSKGVKSTFQYGPFSDLYDPNTYNIFPSHIYSNDGTMKPSDRNRSQEEYCSVLNDIAHSDYILETHSPELNIEDIRFLIWLSEGEVQEIRKEIVWHWLWPTKAVRFLKSYESCVVANSLIKHLFMRELIEPEWPKLTLKGVRHARPPKRMPK